MQTGEREDFERRLLALARSQLDDMDERFPDGWVITEFVVTVRAYVAPDPEVPLRPWEGGPYPGWLINGWTAGSSPEYEVDVELLGAALEHSTRLQNEWLERLRAQDDEDDDENDGNDEDESDEP